MKIRPQLSEIFFSIAFLWTFCFLENGLSNWFTIYLAVYWLWITYVASSSVRHPLTNFYGKSITDANFILSLLTIFMTGFILVLSISFLARVVFAISGFYDIVFYGFFLAFLISISVHFFITMKNLLTINKTQNKIKLVVALLVFPFGIFTIQQTLKQKK